MSLDLFEIAEAVAVEYHLSKLAKKDFNFGVDGYDKRNQIWKDSKSKKIYMQERVDAKNSDRFYKPVLKLKQQEILKDKNFQNFVPKDKFLDTLENGYFSVISAGANPNNDDHKNMINKFPKKAKKHFKQEHKKLKRDLEKLGLPFTEYLGKYGDVEKSYIVFHSNNISKNDEMDKINYMVFRADNDDTTIEELNKLGSKFHQDSVMHCSKGDGSLHYTHGINQGKKCESEGHDILEDEIKDYYSELNVGDNKTKFSMDLLKCFDENVILDYI